MPKNRRESTDEAEATCFVGVRRKDLQIEFAHPAEMSVPQDVSRKPAEHKKVKERTAEPEGPPSGGRERAGGTASN